MRLPKADSRLASIVILSFLFVALVVSQCIFCVPAQAYAQEEGYRELISDYYLFHNPTKIAAGDGLIAVLDDGEVILFSAGGVSSFAVDVKDCDKMCVSDKGVFLLVDAESDDAHLLCYGLTGELMAGKAWMGASPFDISVSGGALYLLDSYSSVTRYDLTDGTESVISLTKRAVYLSADDDRLCLQTARGAIWIQGEAADLASSVDSASFHLSGNAVYYQKGDDLSVIDSEGNKREYLRHRANADDAFAEITDFAVKDGYLYVLDKSNLAVKIFRQDTRDFVRMIGSYGYDLGRLYDPLSISVKEGKVALLDRSRGSVFSASGTKEMTGYAFTDPSDIVIAGEKVFVTDGGKLYEYNAGLVKGADYLFEKGKCRFVTAAPDGTVYVNDDRDIYRKTGDGSFELFLTANGNVEGLNVGIGGKSLYLYAGGKLYVYSQEEVGSPIRELNVGSGMRDFVIDFRGNLFFLSSAGKIVKYVRTLEGYADPVFYDLPTTYASYTDIALDEEGKLYVIADHNVLVYPSSAPFGVIVEESDFKDDVPDASPLFVCEVEKESAIAYRIPGNYEDVITVSPGTKLMCYATVNYQGDIYLRAENEKRVVYLPKKDVRIYEEGSAPLSKARCLIPSVGKNVVGVNIYKEPSHYAIEQGVEPLYASLGKEEIFDVISIVAVDETGADVWGFYRVSYQGETGYVLIKDVVSVDDEPLPAPPRYTLRIKSEGLGKTVALYREPSLESEVVARLTDGMEISALEPLDKEKEFITVLYNGEICYVQSARLSEGGLSGGQILAIVLSVAAVLGSVLTILILRANKRHKRYHKE